MVLIEKVQMDEERKIKENISGILSTVQLLRRSRTYDSAA
jgi:hypothetical protein